MADVPVLQALRVAREDVVVDLLDRPLQQVARPPHRPPLLAQLEQPRVLAHRPLSRHLRRLRPRSALRHRLLLLAGRQLLSRVPRNLDRLFPELFGGTIAVFVEAVRRRGFADRVIVPWRLLRLLLASLASAPAVERGAFEFLRLLGGRPRLPVDYLDVLPVQNIIPALQRPLRLPALLRAVQRLPLRLLGWLGLSGGCWCWCWLVALRRLERDPGGAVFLALLEADVVLDEELYELRLVVFGEVGELDGLAGLLAGLLLTHL